MNFSTTSPLMQHPHQHHHHHQQSSTSPHNNNYPTTTNRSNLSSDDPLNSIRINLADLSVAGTSAGVGGYSASTATHQQQQHQDYRHSGPSNHLSAQLGGNIIGGAGGGGDWTAHNSGILRQHSASSTSISQPHNQQYGPSNSNTNNSTNNNEQRKRGESIDKFLSRSPSQSLGTEFYKFRNDEVPQLSLDVNNSSKEGNVNRSNSIGLVGQQQQQQSAVFNNISSSGHGHGPNHSRQSSYSDGIHENGVGGTGGTKTGRDTSPTCSATGTSTSSRSVSPSWTGGLHDGTRKGSMTGGVVGHTINPYHQSNHHVSVPITATSRGHYTQDINSSYEAISSVQQQQQQQQLYSSGNNNSYESFQGQSSAMNSSFNFSSGGLDTSQDNYQIYHNSNNNSTQSFRSNSGGGDEYQYARQQHVMSQGYNSNMNDNSILNKSTQKQHHPPESNPQPQQQPQVFYMAVPTEDGQGQVLQPIQMQMVQIPGQPNAFVLPAPTVGVNAIPQGGQMGISSGLGFQNPSTHGGGDRKSYGQMVGSRHQLDVSNSRYYEETYGHGYSDDGNHFRSTGRTTEPRESISNATNDIVASLYTSPQRPPLRELLGHVRRLSRDQVGCRLLQQALDEEGTSAASMILKEGLSFWGEAMVDPFGNYLFQKILEKISPEERIVLVQNVSPRLVNASLNLHGTRSVQKVVELCAMDEKENAAASEDNKQKETASEILTRSLTPAAARLCIDSHGNHVIQRILLKLPYHYSHFVFDAVATSVGDVARHRHGCCVIQRCLDSPPSSARSNLVHRIVEKSLELMQDAYGNYVVQYVLDVCSDEDVHAVCESVVGKVTLLAIQKFSSNVMEKCLERCTDKVREHYLTELSDSDRIRELMMDPFGNYVIQRALAVSTHAQAVQLVEAMKPHLFSSTGGGIKNTAGGRRILAKISKRFPNFSLGDEFGADNDAIQKIVQKKHNGGRNENNVAGDQASARFNRRGSGKVDI